MSTSKSNGRDLRKFARIQLSVPVKFLGAGHGEVQGTLLDISPGGLALASQERPEIGSPIVVYVQSLGRMEGRVARHFDQGFAIEFQATDGKRNRLSHRLDSVAAHGSPDQAESSAPIIVREAPTFTMGDGRQMECRVIDMSVHGVQLQVKMKPPVGEEIIIGRMRGRVSQHLTNGIAIEFLGASA